MSELDPDALPQSGGSWTRDQETGALVPAPADNLPPAEPAQQPE